MTIGEKIRYCRTQLNITQARLAELTGIHPVSIRKYETNKMQPLLPQIRRIAAVLGISSNALTGITNVDMPIETVGDLMGLLIVLCNSNILQIKGERDETELLKADTVTISFNPVLSNYLELEKSDKVTKLNDVLLKIKSQTIFNDLLNWEKLNYMYNEDVKLYGNSDDKNIQSALQEIMTKKEIYELELQRSPILLNSTDNISVRINPNY
jgi:transcriptional regulator with XRE-family HTH domain